ncbi:MAG: hypothetical protein CMI02_06170 [Oceanospirillaceae bacterium]|nr:hypothetical protein [Oceanospirillaceae bacterium]MBT11600.1 hypothetical protein [Oceanospirillaceae bacterium]
MKLLTLMTGLILSLSSYAGVLDSLVGSEEPDFLPVDQAFPLDYDVSPGLLTASWNSADGYYLYQHRIFLTQGGQTVQPSYFSLPGKEKEDEAFGLVTAYYGALDVEFQLATLQPGEAVLHYQGCADAGLCYPPQRQTIQLTEADLTAADSLLPQTRAADAEPTAGTAAQTSSQPDNDSWFANRSFAAIIGLFFLLGLGLTFTPCVLPMVPILTSVVLGQGNTSGRKGFILSSVYVLGMAITYALAGLTVGLLGAGANIQAWMQTPWVLILFAVLFVLLALAMFGLYELQLPAGLRNRLNAMSQKQKGGQALSVFVIGILSALVVSPCVSAPLAGALVYISATGDALTGFAALLALGLGMGAPLIILGTTGASVLPKAGNWMNQIKIFFGILLLAVAVWLLSRILPGTISLLLWAMLAIIYAVVLGAFETAATGLQRMIKGIAWVLLLYGVMALAGVLMGNTNPLQPLKLTSLSSAGTAQPAQHSLFYRTDSVTDIEQKIAAASGPVMLDLYADWCISCKVMEEEIFAQTDVQQRLGHVMWLQLDVTANSDDQIAFMQSHGIFGPPTILFFRDNLEVQPMRITGELSKDEFNQRTQGL